MKLFWIFTIKKSVDSALWEEIGAFSIFFLPRVSHICDTLDGIPVMKLPQTSYIAAVNSRSSPQRWKTFPNRWFHSIKHQSTIVNNAVEFFCQSFCSATLNISRGSWKWKGQKHLAVNRVPWSCLTGDAEGRKRIEYLSGTSWDGVWLVKGRECRAVRGHLLFPFLFPTARNFGISCLFPLLTSFSLWEREALCGVCSLDLSVSSFLSQHVLLPAGISRTKFPPKSVKFLPVWIKYHPSGEWLWS